MVPAARAQRADASMLAALGMAQAAMRAKNAAIGVLQDEVHALQQERDTLAQLVAQGAGASGTALVQRLQHLQALLCAELSSPTPAAPPPTACGLHATEQVHAELAAAEAQPAALRAELEQLRQRQQADAVQLAALGAALAASEQQRAALEAELADTAQAAYELWEVVQAGFSDDGERSRASSSASPCMSASLRGDSDAFDGGDALDEHAQQHHHQQHLQHQQARGFVRLTAGVVEAAAAEQGTAVRLPEHGSRDAAHAAAPEPAAAAATMRTPVPAPRGPRSLQGTPTALPPGLFTPLEQRIVSVAGRLQDMLRTRRGAPSPQQLRSTTPHTPPSKRRSDGDGDSSPTAGARDMSDANGTALVFATTPSKQRDASSSRGALRQHATCDVSPARDARGGRRAAAM